MFRASFRRSTIATIIAVTAGTALAADSVGVPGSGAKFSTAVVIQVGGKPVQLALTGAALRKKAIFSVYAMASYLQDGVTAKSAEQLASANGVKMLMLIMERDVGGRDMAEAIQTGVRLNSPPDAFAPELRKVNEVLGAISLRKGDHVMLTSMPGVGLRCQVIGKTDVTIQNPAFAKAIWDIYLGRQNIGEPIKAGLVSRL
jgi:hypothetical protein